MLKWKGKASNSMSPHREHGSIFVYSLPCVGPSLIACPRIFLMESEVVALQNNFRCTSKLMVSLELDYTIGGWLWFETTEHKCKTIGRIIEGRREPDGFMTCHVYFSMQHTKLNSNKEPTNYLATCQVSGHIVQSNRKSSLRFSAKFVKMKDGKTLLSDQSIYLLPHDGAVLEYPCLREAPTQWHRLHQSPLNLFQKTKSIPNITRSLSNLLCDKVMSRSLLGLILRQILLPP